MPHLTRPLLLVPLLLLCAAAPAEVPTAGRPVAGGIDETKKTAPDGTAATRGFLGEYEITATLNGKSKTVTATLKKGAAPVEVRLP